MTPPSGPDAALAAARRHVQETHAALAAALHPPGDDDTDADVAGGRRAAGDLPRHSLVMQFAEHAVAPWAAERPWTLMALAAAAGALLASRRGRGVLGSVAMAALLAPPPGRRGLPALGAAGFGWLLRRRSAPPRPPR